MPDTHPVINPHEPVVRLGTPPSIAPGASHPNHPVLLPEADADDDVVPSLPAPRVSPPVAAKLHWYRALVRPTAYVASALAGAVLVTVLYGILGSRAATNGHSGSDAAPGGLVVSDTATLDRRADTLALAISAFTMRASMYDSRRMPCGWLGYNIARKDLMAGSDPARDSRDKRLYADVRAVELRFERSSCARP